MSATVKKLKSDSICESYAQMKKGSSILTHMYRPMLTGPRGFYR